MSGLNTKSWGNIFYTVSPNIPGASGTFSSSLSG